MKKIVCALTFSLLAPAGFSITQEKPTPEEAKKVINYYFNGKGQGVIPVEYKLCEKVAVNGEQKNECVSEISGSTVVKGQKVYLWMNFLVPAGENAKILLQYSRENLVRDTANVSLGGATRYRTWKRIPTSTTGDWKVNVFQEMANEDLEIGQLEFSVIDGNQ